MFRMQYFCIYVHVYQVVGFSGTMDCKYTPESITESMRFYFALEEARATYSLQPYILASLAQEVTLYPTKEEM